jgi:hypothetical protein
LQDISARVQRQLSPQTEPPQWLYAHSGHLWRCNAALIVAICIAEEAPSTPGASQAASQSASSRLPASMVSQSGLDGYSIVQQLLHLPQFF